MLTVDELAQALPHHIRSAANQSLVDKLNKITADPEDARAIRENFISYTTVLAEGRFKIEDYLNAVSYVSYKLMGHSNKEAYKRTFPARYSALLQAGKTDKEISAYVSHYSKGRLVALILEQSVIPSWVLNQDVYQAAINTQFELMRTANSEKVRSDAANSILTHLKKPETKKVEIDLGVKEHSGLESLRDNMQALAEQQLKLIQLGMNTKEIAHHRLVQDVEEAEVVEVDDKQ